MKLSLSRTITARDLTERHNIEEQFHDERTQRGAKPSARMDFYSSGVNDEHFRILLEAAGSLQGKHVLDFGCGMGQTSRIYAGLGAARVDGFDISSENIRVAEMNAKRDGLDDRVFFRHLAAEEIDYPDESFDLVLGKAILHHTDLEKTSKQLARVLRLGGSAYFLEPLAHNPALNLFRWLTPSRRTPTEKPLRLEDLDVFRKHFDTVSYRGFYLFTLLANGLLLVTGSRKLFTGAMTTLLEREQPLLTRFPFLQKYCWTALLFFHKATEPKASALEARAARAR
jgi:2-polyprenyl-3-methyl-5-hydroxy-6-metoxy-1,4-benzoquinol methylase